MSRAFQFAFILALLAGVSVCLAAPAPNLAARKQLSGPPEEFVLHSLPDPQLARLESWSSQYPLHLDDAFQKGKPYILHMPIDTTRSFQFTFFSPYFDELTLALFDPSGNEVTLSPMTDVYPIGSDGLNDVACTNYIVDSPKVGTYSLYITNNNQRKAVWTQPPETYLPPSLPDMGDQPDAYIIFDSGSDTAVVSYLSSYDLQLGQEIGLIAYAFQESRMNNRSRFEMPEVWKEAIDDAVMQVQYPDGTQIRVDMADDGLHGDGEANDGIYGANISATEAGNYVAQAVLWGKDNRKGFVRTTTQLIPVTQNKLSLTGSAFLLSSSTSGRATVFLEIELEISQSYKPYAEVYSRTANGDEALCWISGIVEPTEMNGYTGLGLGLDLQWLVRGDAPVTQLVLKNVYVQDTENHIPVALYDEIVVQNEDMEIKDMLVNAGDAIVPGDLAITERMRNGPRPSYLIKRKESAENGPVVLVHGYCSHENPFEAYPSDWTNPMFFKDLDANKPIDEFAQLVIAFTNDLDSFSLVGHSQGGMVNAHIHNYYWTALENAEGGRLLQSIGTPYYGNSAAGSAANLVKIFGVACGANSDLTTDGASLWMTGITSDTLADLYFYTTQYGTGNLLNYCNLATNLVLKSPNDGTAEYNYEVLPNANDCGHKKKWCHSLKMHWPPQCEDHDRNAEMNNLAAR